MSFFVFFLLLYFCSWPIFLCFHSLPISGEEYLLISTPQNYRLVRPLDLGRAHDAPDDQNDETDMRARRRTFLFILELWALNPNRPVKRTSRFLFFSFSFFVPQIRSVPDLFARTKRVLCKVNDEICGLGFCILFLFGRHFQCNILSLSEGIKEGRSRKGKNPDWMIGYGERASEQ